VHATGWTCLNAGDSLRRTVRSDDIHRLATFIAADPFWNALIDQVVVHARTVSSS
jgi:hypothetical protein